MNEYRFIINNYHAIENADISIDGITVIAGCNGCGKSTISKWLYALVNYTNEFNGLVDFRLLKRVNDEIRKMLRLNRSIGLSDENLFRRIKSLTPAVFEPDYSGYDKLYQQFESRLNVFCQAVDRAVRERNDDHFKKWVQRSLGTDDGLFGNYLSTYYDTTLSNVHDSIEQALSIKNRRSTADLLTFIRKELDIYGDAPRDFAFRENGLTLIDPVHFVPPFGLGNAIYIDTPMALSKHQSSDNYVWMRLMQALAEFRHEMPAAGHGLVARLERIIGGNVLLRRDEFNDEPDIRYVRKKDGLNIPIEEAATGLKSFAYMLRLIENGFLDENSLLLIDEPEAHLHPQWIVEFARILVLLNKELGTKVMVASHNPDMIAALQSISCAEGIDGMTRFYQACPDESGLRYSYEDLGNDIEKIFSSFNVALDRIEYYGK